MKRPGLPTDYVRDNGAEPRSGVEDSSKNEQDQRIDATRSKKRAMDAKAKPTCFAFWVLRCDQGFGLEPYEFFAFLASFALLRSLHPFH